MNQHRRLILKGSVASGVLAVAAGAGLLTPGRVLAAWPQTAFESKELAETLKSLFGSEALTESGDIKIKAPEIAENGAVVPVSISTTLPNVESISIFAKNNPQPLTSTYKLGPGADAFVSTRIKMGKTSDIIAVVKSGGKLLAASKEVKVTIGGCGG